VHSKDERAAGAAAHRSSRDAVQECQGQQISTASSSNSKRVRGKEVRGLCQQNACWSSVKVAVNISSSSSSSRGSSTRSRHASAGTSSDDDCGCQEQLVSAHGSGGSTGWQHQAAASHG